MRTEFRQAYVEADGLRTRYAEAGPESGPAVIMLHGTGAHWETFCRNIPSLSDTFRCFAIDMLGCGFTDKPDRPYEIKDYVQHLASFMEVKGISKASIIGVSLGSWVAAGMAITHPSLVEKLILCSPSGLLPGPPTSNIVGARMGAVEDPSWDNIYAVLRPLILSPNDVLDDMVTLRQQIYSEPNMRTLMPRQLTLQDQTYREQSLFPDETWRALSAETMIVKAVGVTDSSTRTADGLMALLPNATLLEMPGTAHWPHFEDAELFNTRATQFLQN